MILNGEVSNPTSPQVFPTREGKQCDPRRPTGARRKERGTANGKAQGTDLRAKQITVLLMAVSSGNGDPKWMI